ncbi:MAG TPA: hypothetical protein VFA56_13520 [Gaiellaceae bacterium]|nr:hypothetical protein [Gaiellaceae bacterium]
MTTELLAPHEPAAAPAPRDLEPCRAETAECTCPDFCERDHEND